MFEKLVYPSYKHDVHINEGGPAPSENQSRIRLINKSIVDLKNFLQNPKNPAYTYLQSRYVQKSLLHNEKADQQIAQYKAKAEPVPKGLTHKTPAELCREDLEKYETEVKMRTENPAFTLSDGEVGYKALWEQALDGLKNDSMLLDYYKAFKGEAYKEQPEELAQVQAKTSLSSQEITECLEKLKSHFAGEENSAIKNHLEHLRVVVGTVSMISTPSYDSDTINPSLFQLPNQGKKSIIGNLVFSLNYLNGKIPGEPYKGDETDLKTETPFLQEAYNYNETSGYDKAQNDIEALLVIRLGQLTKGITSHVNMIESVTPLYEAQNLESVSKEAEQDTHSLFAEVKDVKQFQVDAAKHQKELNDLEADLRRFELAPTSEQATNELLLRYGDTYETLIKKKTEELISEALKEREMEADIAFNNAKSQLRDSREKTIAYNQRLQKDYEDALANNERILPQIEKEESVKKADLEKFDRDITAIETEISDYTNSRAALKDEKLKEQQQYDLTMSELQAENAKLIAQLAKIQKSGDIVKTTLPDPEVLDNLNDLESRLKTLHEIQLAFDNIVGNVDYNQEKAAVEEALGTPEITDKQLAELGNTSKKSYDPAKHLKALNIKVLQQSYKDSIEKKFGKTEDPAIKQLFSDINKCSAKGMYANPDTRALSYLEKLIDKTRLEKEKILSTHKEYFRNKAEYERLINDENFPSDIDKALKESKEKIANHEKTNPDFNSASFDEETELKLKDLNSKIPSIKEQRTEIEQAHDNEINYLNRQLKEANKPELIHEKTDDEIETEARQAYDKLFDTQAKEKIKADITKTVRVTHKQECLAQIKGSVSKKKQEVSLLVDNDKRITKGINKLFEDDKRFTQKSNELKEKITGSLEQHNAKKEAYFEQLKDELQAYSGNMERGKKKGHSNTPEFKNMMDHVKTAFTLLEKFTSKDPNVVKPTLAQIKTGLNEMKDYAFIYKTEKEKQFRPFASSMRKVRLAMADQLMKAADNMIKGIENHESLGKLMTLEAQSKVVSSNREVVENETAFDHFERLKEADQKRIEKHQEMRQKLVEKTEKLKIKESSKKSLHTDDFDVKKNPLTLDDEDKLKTVAKDDAFSLH